ncbi:MAG: M23 family metallopeptidase [Oxalobacteraceae bacterium]|nr:MAG: M23 family metallopeptidase [Oxalobacteraceae bacterium]
MAGRAGSARLQPAFSASVPSIAPAPPIAPQAPLATWRYPLDRPRITSLYGVVSPSVPKGHHGIDLAAPRGTPVLAVAAGTVLEAAFDAAWGHYVRVDHGADTSSLLIHLDRIDVAPGQRVKAGELLGTSGASGKATGPHLHLEYWEGRQRLDPVQMLPDLLQHATKKAIARREAQGNPVPTDR